MYEYKAKLIRVIDSNTIEAYINLGFDITIIQKIKLFGVPTSTQLAITTRLIPKEFILHSILNRRGKVGRILGYIFTADSNNELSSINDLLIGSNNGSTT